MNIEKTIKKLSKNLESCNICGLAEINCICKEAPKLETKLKFYILTNELELYRPSNTAKLLKLCSDNSVEIIVWERKRISPIIEKIIQGDNTYLVYLPKGETENLQSEKMSKSKLGRVSNEINLIILDGTWNETDKIFRKSEYLKELPILKLNEVEKSSYKLRKGAGEGELCTIEAIIQVFKENEEFLNAEKLAEFYELFKMKFYASLHGHK